MKNRPVKTAFLAALALAAAAFVLAPSSAEAQRYHGHSHYHGGHGSCGTCGSCRAPVSYRTVVVGYDYCGRPVYRRVPVARTCSGHRGYHHGGSHYSRPGYHSGYHSSSRVSVYTPGFSASFVSPRYR